MTEEITEAIRNAFNEYLNAVDKIILENQALQIELQRLEQENKELEALNKKICEDCSDAIKVYWDALEEIKEKLKYWEFYFCDNCPFKNKSACDKNEKDIGENTCTSVQFIKMQNKINEVLNDGRE